MVGREVIPHEVPRKCQIPDLFRPVEVIRGKVHQQRNGEQEPEVHRQYPQSSSSVKMPEIDPTRLIMFDNHEPRDEEPADQEKAADTQITVKSPAKE
jgi:hypothetical protein